MTRWLRDWWHLPWFALAAGVVWLVWKLRRKSGSSWLQKVQNEVAAVRAGQDARTVAEQLGLQEALAHVRDKYARVREQVRADVAQRIKEIEHDPEALARALERASRAGAPGGP